jgi:hypothetical protein
MTIDENEDLNVTDLTDIFKELTVIRTEQRQLKEEVTDLKSQVRAQQQRSKRSTQVPVNTDATVGVNNRRVSTAPRTLRRKDITIGDQVTIINPKGRQLSEGTVVGFTPTGFVRVETADKNIIRRFPFNLRKP